MYFQLRIISILIVLFFSSACNEKQNTIEIPNTIIDQTNMVSLLIDIHLTEAKIKFLKKQKNNRITTQEFSSMYDQPFVAHHILPKQFEQSLSFYSSQPELFESVYENMISIMEEKKIILDKPDSIKKVLSLPTK